MGDASKETLLALKSSDRMGERQRLLVMAAYYSAAARPSEAIGAYEQLLSIWPGDLTTQVNVAATALESQQWTLGLELARRAVADHPYSSVAQSNLLLALVATGRFAEAVKTGDALLRDDTSLPPFAYAFVALAHALEGDWEGALDVYARLTPLDAAYADEGRTDLALQEGRLDDAVALARPQLEKALARGDTSAGEDQYQGLSIALLRKGNASGAARMARGAIGNDSGVPFLYGLARALEGRGDPPAIAAYRSFLRRRTGAQGDRLVRDAEQRLATLNAAGGASPP